MNHEERIALKKLIDQALRSRVSALPAYCEHTEAERTEYLRIKKQESRRRQRGRGAHDAESKDRFGNTSGGESTRRSGRAGPMA